MMLHFQDVCTGFENISHDDSKIVEEESLSRLSQEADGWIAIAPYHGCPSQGKIGKKKIVYKNPYLLLNYQT